VRGRRSLESALTAQSTDKLLHNGFGSAPKWPIRAVLSRLLGWLALAFTLAPHLQIINHRGRFSRIAGI
jgi:hypothetical protein